MYYRLRTRRDTPRQKALAVWLGTAVGCTPLFGLHLPMCIALARIAGLNVVTTYLASYINNPLVAPFTLYLALAVGRWIFNGHWPALNVDEVHATSMWHLGRDVLVGSLVIGIALGGMLAALAYRFSRPVGVPTMPQQLIENTARRYLDSGVVYWELARGKLRFDPFYLWLIKASILPRNGRLADLGCGHGVLLCLLVNARRLYAGGHWGVDWPPPPTELNLTGIEGKDTNATVARSALNASVELRIADIRVAELPPCEVVTLLNVLSGFTLREQCALIARIAAALKPGGLLLIREADVDSSMRFMATRLVKRVAAWRRGEWRQQFHYRGVPAWISLLENHGFKASIRAISERSLFAYVLIEARKS
jgi:uncharacterized protein (DUF2062 family)